MLVLGVDPGLGGALCAFYGADEEGGELVADVIDMPVLEDGTKHQIDVTAAMRWFRQFNAGVAYVENVQPMPSIPDKKSGKRRAMGAASSFRFGMAVGQIRGALAAVNVEVRLIHPQSWKRIHGLKGADKEASRQLALRTWPDAERWLRRKKDDGRAEAILIAAAGVRSDYPGP
jgi:crossover junction endodeoxyribonuclease RuvC